MQHDSLNTSSFNKDLPSIPILRSQISPERRSFLDASDSASQSLDGRFPPLAPKSVFGSGSTDKDSEIKKKDFMNGNGTVSTTGTYKDSIAMPTGISAYRIVRNLSTSPCPRGTRASQLREQYVKSRFPGNTSRGLRDKNESNDPPQQYSPKKVVYSLDTVKHNASLSSNAGSVRDGYRTLETNGRGGDDATELMLPDDEARSTPEPILHPSEDFAKERPHEIEEEKRRKASRRISKYGYQITESADARGLIMGTPVETNAHSVSRGPRITREILASPELYLRHPFSKESNLGAVELTHKMIPRRKFSQIKTIMVEMAGKEVLGIATGPTNKSTDMHKASDDWAIASPCCSIPKTKRYSIFGSLPGNSSGHSHGTETCRRSTSFSFVSPKFQSSQNNAIGPIISVAEGIKSFGKKVGKIIPDRLSQSREESKKASAKPRRQTIDTESQTLKRGDRQTRNTIQVNGVSPLLEDLNITSSRQTVVPLGIHDLEMSYLDRSSALSNSDESKGNHLPMRNENTPGVQSISEKKCDVEKPLPSLPTDPNIDVAAGKEIDDILDCNIAAAETKYREMVALAKYSKDASALVRQNLLEASNHIGQNILTIRNARIAALEVEKSIDLMAMTRASGVFGDIVVAAMARRDANFRTN
jgi:hypothetical protein